MAIELGHMYVATLQIQLALAFSQLLHTPVNSVLKLDKKIQTITLKVLAAQKLAFSHTAV